jgi:hypothetical protein
MKKIKQFFDTNFNRVNPKWNIYKSFGFFIIIILPWLLQLSNNSNSFTALWAVLSLWYVIFFGICYLFTLEIIKVFISRIFETLATLFGSLFIVIFLILIIGGLIGILIFGWKQIL